MCLFQLRSLCRVWRLFRKVCSIFIAAFRLVQRIGNVYLYVGVLVTNIVELDNIVLESEKFEELRSIYSSGSRVDLHMYNCNYKI